MSWIDLFPQTAAPDLAQISAYIASPYWGELRQSLEATYGVQPRLEYSSCSAMPGWNVKYKKSGRALCTLYPEEQRFTALVCVSCKEPLAAEHTLSLCSPAVQQLHAQAPPYNGNRWLMIPVTDAQALADVERLIALRMGKGSL